MATPAFLINEKLLITFAYILFSVDQGTIKDFKDFHDCHSQHFLHHLRLIADDRVVNVIARSGVEGAGEPLFDWKVLERLFCFFFYSPEINLMMGIGIVIVNEIVWGRGCTLIRLLLLFTCFLFVCSKLLC